MFTQYEADKLKNDISRVMHVNNDYQKTHLVRFNPYSCHKNISDRRQRIMDMRAEINEIERRQWREYKQERLAEKRNRMISYPYRDENELIDDYLTQEAESDAARRQNEINAYWKRKNSTDNSRNRARDYWNRRNSYHASASYW